MRFEYKLQIVDIPTIYNNAGSVSISDLMLPPEGFRFRDVKLIEYAKVASTAINGTGGSTTSHNSIFKAMVTWEKAVAEKEEF